MATLEPVDELSILPDREMPPVPFDRALDLAADGDRLELDLHASGIYGDETGMDAAAGHGVALRALGTLLAQMREQTISRRWGTDENTLLNFAFLHGHQYVEVDRGRRAVVATPAPRDAVRRTINKMESWYLRKHGRLTAGIPAHHIRPKTRQQLDRDASAFGEELSEWRVPSLYSLDNRAECAMWKLLAGNVVIFCGVEWTEDGEYMVDLADPDPETGEPKALHRPDIVEEVVAPQACWCDDRIPTIKKMRWFGRDLYVPTAEARATYPEASHLLTVEMNRAERGRHVLRRVQGMNMTDDPWSGGAVTSPSDELMDEEETILSEFWLKKNAVLSAPFLDLLDASQIPCEVLVDQDGGGDAVVRFPEGLRIVMTPDGEVLEAGENIYGWLPFREMRYSKGPGFWAIAPATVLREIQKALNWFASMRETHAIKVANAPLMTPRDARVHRRGGLLSGMARVLYKPNRFNAKPEYLNPGNLPADYVQGEQRMEEVWADLASDHDVSQGNLPSADLSGVTVSLLQESDLMALGFAGEEQESAFVDLVRMELLLIQKFFPENDPRLVQLAGDAPYRMQAFMQADLEHGLDIQVVSGSSIPRSPAAVEAKAQEGWRDGWLTDKYGRPDAQTMRKIYGFGSEDDLQEEEEIDCQNARSEEEQILALPVEACMLILAAGILPPPLEPQPEDDAIVHEHSHRMRLKRLRQDPGRVDPMNIDVLRMHWEATVQIIAPILLQQDPATFMSAMGGAPPPGEPGEESGEPTDQAPAPNAA